MAVRRGISNEAVNPRTGRRPVCGVQINPAVKRPWGEPEVLLFTARGGAADEAVTDADDGLDGVAARAQFGAQASDVNVQRARVAVVLLPPHLVEELVARRHAPGAARERGEEAELLARELDLRAATGHVHVLETDEQPVVLVNGGRGLI